MNKKQKTISIPIVAILAIISIICIIVTIGTKQVINNYLIANSAEYKNTSASTTADGRFEYTVLNDGTIEISKYVRKDTEVIIPSTIDGKSVTSIGGYAFQYCSNLMSVEIPNSVTSIGGYAFSSCRSLTSIKIPEGVTSIGERAFEECDRLTEINVETSNKSYASERGVLFNKSKTEIICYPFKKEGDTYTIPEGVTSIGGAAFKGCSILTSIKIPEGVTSIGDYAFRGCTSLTNIKIPSSVTSIGNCAFEYCSSLTEINVENGNKSYVSEKGVLFNKGKTEIIYYPAKKEEDTYTIPKGVTSIGDSAFEFCNSLTSIKIPEGVTSIGDCAFGSCSSLTSIEIPNSVTRIGEDAFYSCKSLTSIKIPEGVTSIGGHTFQYCISLTSIEIPNSVTSIGEYAFCSCSRLMSIKIPEGVTSIGECAFEDCSRLTEINVETSNKNYASERGVLFNKSKTEIIRYPEKKEGDTYTIPNSVTSIRYRAFSYCSSLTSIAIPNSVTRIGEDAFYFCSSLTIYCKSDSEAEKYAKDNSIQYTIDDEAPTISSVSGNPTQWTREDVMLTINGAQDKLVGLANKPYSFDGGETWQSENTKTYDKKTSGIVIKVRDALGNIYTHEEINITKIEEISITTNKYKISGEYITKIPHKTTFKTFKTNIITNAEQIKLFDKSGKELGETDIIGTGMTLTLKLGTRTNNFKLVVSGDVTGDGKADFKDIVLINKHRLHKKALEGEYLIAADVTEDDKVDFKDIVKINEFRLNKITQLFSII